jgi:two-component system OmpR family sensor kinase
MHPFRHLSVRARLAMLAATGAMVVLTVGALLLYRSLSTELSTAITDELAIRVDDLAAGVGGDATSPPSAFVIAQAVDHDGAVLAPIGSDPVLTGAELTMASTGEVVVDREVPGIGEDARLLARPISGSGADVVVGVAATSSAPLVHARERLASVLVIAGPILAAAVGALAWVLAGAALRPVHRMTSEAATISGAAPGRRLAQPEGGDEIAELGRTLNAMLGRIERTIAHERAFIDDAAHELRTPLAVLRGELELAALDSGDAEAMARSLASALEETDRLTAIANGLLTLARADAGQLVPGAETADLLEVADEVVRSLPHRDGIAVEVQGDPVTVQSDPEWIRTILTNLVTNADRYARSRVLVTIRAVGPMGRASVTDDGPGFTPELLPFVFDRFARGGDARPRGGAGLGLAIVSTLTEALGGTVRARNGGALGGALVRVEIPLPGP